MFPRQVIYPPRQTRQLGTPPARSPPQIGILPFAPPRSPPPWLSGPTVLGLGHNASKRNALERRATPRKTSKKPTPPTLRGRPYVQPGVCEVQIQWCRVRQTEANLTACESALAPQPSTDAPRDRISAAYRSITSVVEPRHFTIPSPRGCFGSALRDSLATRPPRRNPSSFCGACAKGGCRGPSHYVKNRTRALSAAPPA